MGLKSKKLLLLIFFISYINSNALERIKHKIKKYEEKIQEIELIKKQKNKTQKTKKQIFHDIFYKMIIYAYKKKIVAFEDKIFIIFETGIYLINEKRILQYKKINFGKDFQYQTFEKYENGKKKIFITNSNSEKCFTINFLYTKKMIINTYNCKIPKNQKVHISHNLIIYSKSSKVTFLSFENKNLKTLGSQIFPETLNILNIKKFEKVYYLFTNKEIYYIDNYSLKLNHVLTHPEEIEAVNVVYTSFGSFVVYKIKNKDLLIFEQVMKNLQFRKALRFRLFGKLVFVDKKFLVVRREGKLRIFKMEDVLRDGEVQFLEFGFFLEGQTFLTVFEDFGYNLFFLSKDFGIVRYGFGIEGDKAEIWVFWRIFDNLWGFLIPCFISFVVIYFSYNSFHSKKSKKLEVKSKILKDRLSKFLKKNKKTIDDINKKTKLVEKDLQEFIKEVKE